MGNQYSMGGIRGAVRLLLLAVALLVGGRFARGAEPRTFTSRSGQTIDATLAEYNPRTRQVTLTTKDGRPVRIKAAALSEADQAYLSKWNTRRELSAPGRFMLEARRKTISKNKTSTDSRTTEIKEMGYEISLRNTSRTEIKGLVVKYCLYVEEKDQEINEESPLLPALVSTKEVAALAPSASEVFVTLPVSVRRIRSKSTWSSYGRKSSDSSLKGIWLKLFLEGDKEPLRELAVPEKLTAIAKWEQEEDDEVANEEAAEK